MIQIKKAVRTRVFLKIAAMGPSGSGKTFGTIGLAKGLAPTGKILMVDTENGSASYYADKWDFDVVDMHAPFTAQKYMEVLNEAVRLGYEVIVFDSLSHEWAASGGVLDKKADFDRQKGEKWGNWQDAKKPHSMFKEAWLQAPIHVVATMRSKMEYVLETNDKGKQVPRKVGLAPIQDGDSEYEFGVTFEIDRDTHLATAAKDRTGLFDGRTFHLGEDIGRELAGWLASGAELAPQEPPSAPATATNGTASPAAKEDTQAPQPGAQSATQPGAQAQEPDPIFVELLAELAAVTLKAEMPEKSRQALITLWEKDGPADLDALRQEITNLKATIKTETPREALQAQQAEALERKAPVSQSASTFVDGLECDEAAGGISPEQYQALNALIPAFGLNRDALRAYCQGAGHLLPGKNGPTLARLKAEQFTKLRDKLVNKTKAGKDPQGKDETWSARTVRIINATPVPQPYALAS